MGMMIYNRKNIQYVILMRIIAYKYKKNDYIYLKAKIDLKQSFDIIYCVYQYIVVFPP